MKVLARQKKSQSSIKQGINSDDVKDTNDVYISARLNPLLSKALILTAPFFRS